MAQNLTQLSQVNNDVYVAIEMQGMRTEARFTVLGLGFSGMARKPGAHGNA